jgi:D-lactate dehydrogenase
MAAMPALVDASPAAIELLDAESLRVAQTDPVADAMLRGIAVRSHAALLVEWQEADADRLAAATETAGRVLGDLPTLAPARLSTDAAERAALWHIRKGLYATVAGSRPSGTTALLEDVAVPVPDLADLCTDLTGLFKRHGYERSVIFGHAKDGNLHFMLTERFEPGKHPERYAAFTEDLVSAVLARGGTLKAEHGTGRVMAPYVRRQYGDELYDVMVELKRLCDPAGVLNPGVVLTDDAALHLRDLKVVETVEPEVDRCVECGYCEPVCPSRDLTTTPRQRIVLRREMAAAEAAGDDALLTTLHEEYEYDAVDTCAVDGMCATACPVLINTGDLTKRLRAEAASRPARAVWSGAAKAWGPVTAVMGRALDVASLAPAPLVERTTGALRAVVDHDVLPQWRRDVPAGGRRRRPDPVATADAVYVPSCLNTMFAAQGDGPGVMDSVRNLAERAGIRLHVPAEIESLCCGTPWSSKGMIDGYATVQRRVRTVLEAATGGGRLPVVTDAASCSEGFERLLATAGSIVTVVDAVPFVAEHVLPRLTVQRRLRSLVLHPTCSSRRLGIDSTVLRLAEAVADDVVVPVDWQCCAFAGDRGLLHPELTASATRAEAAEIASRDFDAYASVNRTCEIGMTRATGHSYQHLLELVEQVSRPKRGETR